MEKKKLVIEIEMDDGPEGQAVKIIHALTGMINAVFEDDGPLHARQGDAYSLDSFYENDDGSAVLSVTWQWHNHKELREPTPTKAKEELGEPKYLDRDEAAAYVTAKGLRYSKNTLQKMVTTGGGPPFRRFGLRAVYTKDDLDAWIAQKISEPRRTAVSRAEGQNVEVRGDGRPYRPESSAEGATSTAGLEGGTGEQM